MQLKMERASMINSGYWITFRMFVFNLQGMARLKGICWPFLFLIGERKLKASAKGKSRSL